MNGILKKPDRFPPISRLVILLGIVIGSTVAASAATATPTISPVAGTYTTTRIVTIGDATAGSTIYYTISGNAPTTASAVYTGPLSVASSMPVRAMAVAAGVASAVATAVYTVTPASTPTFSVAAGSYSSTQAVTISDATAGARIYYTTTGNPPTTASTPYTGPVQVDKSLPLRAVAVYPNGPMSQTATAVYTITLAATPTFSVPAGAYSATQTVTISDATAGARIYYTTTGNPPTTASTPYTGPVQVDKSLTLRAIALYPNGPSSQTTTAVYTITQAATPTFSVPAGTYSAIQTVTISDSTAGAVIHYTTSGNPPTTSSTLYTGPITVASSLPLRAMAVFTGGPVSPVATANYIITPTGTPTFSPGAGTYNVSQSVTIGDTTSGAVIYYTTSGNAPTTSSTRYTSPITVTGSLPLRAFAVSPNAPPSAVATAPYTITPAATPSFNLAAGTYTGIQSVSIFDATAGAVIYYTTSGNPPTTSSTRYTGPVSVSSTLPLRAIARYPGGPLSPVATAYYTIRQATEPIATPNSSSTFFGLNINHLLGGTPWPNLSFSTLRLWDSGTRWGETSAHQNTYNWMNLDTQMNLARANNTKVIFTFGGVPAWALASSVPIQSVKRSSGVVTVTTTAPHSLYYSPRQSPISQSMFSIAGVTDNSFNGNFYLTGTPSANILTYAQAGADTASSSGSFSVICGGGDAPATCAEAPADLSSWDEYITQLISHVGPGAIQYWEMWNEPNLSNYWRGDPMVLVTMTEHAQRIIKSVDPGAIFLSPAVTENYETPAECAGATLCGNTWIDNWLSLGGKNYIDVVSFHGYPVLGHAPEQIQGAVDLLSRTMTANGVGSMPLWDTESGWGTNNGLPDQADQAAWLGRHLLLEQSMGVQRSMWYAYDSGSWGSLWDATTGMNRAGTAYEQMEKWLSGTTLDKPCAASENDSTTYSCSYVRSNGYVAQAVWNTAGAKSFSVSPEFVQYRDLSAGTVRSIVGGTVEISTSPVLLENSTAF